MKDYLAVILPCIVIGAIEMLDSNDNYSLYELIALLYLVCWTLDRVKGYLTDHPIILLIEVIRWTIATINRLLIGALINDLLIDYVEFDLPEAIGTLLGFNIDGLVNQVQMFVLRISFCLLYGWIVELLGTRLLAQQ